jgi:hypothetical protein
LRPCCKHGGAPSAREGPLPILVLLSPRPKRLERGILRRGRARTARCTQGGIHGDNSTTPHAGGVASARDHSCSVGARGKDGHVVYVRPFPERMLDGIVRRGIRLPSALAPAQEHATLGGREMRGGGSPRGIGRPEQLIPLHRGPLARADEARDRLIDPRRKILCGGAAFAVV